MLVSIVNFNIEANFDSNWGQIPQRVFFTPFEVFFIWTAQTYLPFINGTVIPERIDSLGPQEVLP